MRMKLTWSVLVIAACLFGATNLAAKADPFDGGNYTAKDKEFYLTPEQMVFVRPGLELEILDVVIPADLQPEVTFKITDPAGLELDKDGVYTPGPVSLQYVLAYIPAGETAYYAYTEYVQTSPITGESSTLATYDHGGTYTNMGGGTYMYKFGTVVPAGYEMDSTHTLGLAARRDLTEFGLDRYVDNQLEHFIPSGMGTPMPREIVTSETCNGRCHDPLAMHGGIRQAIGYCILCHNPWQEIDPDTGNSVDMPLMTHKIHMGAGLENGYNIIGYRQSNHDYSEVIYPAEITECESCHTGGTPTENFPMVATPAAALVCDYSGKGETTLTWEYTGSVEVQVRANADATGKVFARGGASGSAKTGKWVADGMIFDLYDMATMELIQSVPVNATVLGCVSNAPGSPRGVAGMQHSNWLDSLSRKTCGSCHDGVDFEAGVGHIKQTTDGSCHYCHKPVDGEFDLSVAGAHTTMYKSAQLGGMLFKFVDIKNTNPGDKPTVTFTVGGKNGYYNPNELNRLNLVLSGPNDDFSFYVSESAVGSSVSMGNNQWSYTFKFEVEEEGDPTALPMDAMGSYTVSMEGRDYFDVMVGNEVLSERDFAQNPMMAFAVTDDSPMERRLIVDNEKCESCHLSLSLHGGNRTEAQYCTTCHMPSLVDIADPAESVNQRWMIHKIHRGADLENGYTVIRSRGTYVFDDIHYTGDLRNCEACHVNGSEQLPLPSGLLDQVTPNFWWDPVGPSSSACLSCHDSDETAVHAYVNSTSFGESCSTCHGEGKEAAVDKVHAR